MAITLLSHMIQKNSFFSENESYSEAIAFIKEAFKKYKSKFKSIDFFGIQSERTNKFLNNRYKLEKNDKYILSIRNLFFFRSKKGQLWLFNAEVSIKVIDFRRKFLNLYLYYYENLKIEDIVVYDTDNNPVTDENKLLIDLMDYNGYICIDIFSKIKQVKKTVYDTKKGENISQNDKNVEPESLIKVYFEFIKSGYERFSHKYDINQTILEIENEIKKEYNIGLDKKVTIQYKEGEDYFIIDKEMTLEDIIDEMKEEPKTKTKKPRNVLYIKISEKAKKKQIRSIKPSISRLAEDSDIEKRLQKHATQLNKKKESNKSKPIQNESESEDVICRYFYQTNKSDEIKTIELKVGSTIKDMKAEICNLHSIDNESKIEIHLADEKLQNNIIIDDLNVGDEIFIVYIQISKNLGPTFFDSKTIKKLLQKKQIIGTGKTATVYKVNNIMTGEGFLAVKIFNKYFTNSITKGNLDSTENKDFWSDDKELFDNDEMNIPINIIRSIFQEWELLTYLNHPNIIKTFGFYNGDKTQFPMFVLEYCLHNLEESIKHLEDIELVRITYEICSAMQYLHKKGIIHRDLTAKNILINTNKNVKVCDFGISKIVDAKTLTSMTHGVGTLIYMAPELFDENSKITEKVDVYAFGVVLHFIVTKGSFPEWLMNKLLQNCEFPKNVTNLAKSLIKKCLSFSSEDRPSFTDIIKMIVDNHFNLFNGIDETISSLGITS